MTRTRNLGIAACGAVAAVAGIWLGYGEVWGQNGNLQTPPVDITIRDDLQVAPADQQSQQIVAAARAFLDTLSEDQTQQALFDFADNTQRSNWSNFPDGPVVRKGVMRGDLQADQLDALDALLRTVMSEDGYRNILLQLAAEETLDTGGGGPNFGDEYYYASFLGEPSTDAPWMFQFGGHHLAINVTVAGPDLAFSPMLTGGEPLNIEFDGADVFITEAETRAAAALMDSLTVDQRAMAIRSDEIINLLLGPGAFGTVLAPEGIQATQLDDAQRQLLLDVIAARLGFMNDDDFAAKMAVIEADLDATWFGWWGPVDELGAAYFRVTAPSAIIEYAPQNMRGDIPTDHAHNMYRDPGNDYGIAWIAEP
ncbi:DUF3500 domain-containing protein [Psychromarinibacter sp. S121]|uniref:DUF3500 domain-containing protein n=1 Tax=Psychromarinibacter sp. S121 TaxID=3415127 RepID=UPI003C7A56A3